MATQLDGTKPLWKELRDYLAFVQQHGFEIHDHYMAGDENADMIVRSVVAFGENRALADRPRWREAFAVVVERYIAEHHPDIAVIVKK